MLKIVNATEAKNKFGEIIRQVYLYGNHLMINKGEIPVAAIIPLADYEQIINQQKNSGDIINWIKKAKKNEMARKRFIAFLEKQHQKRPKIAIRQAEADIRLAIKSVRKKYEGSS